MQVIIFTNPSGLNVAVCNPSEDSDINFVLEKDCPPGAIIVDDSILPEDHTYFNAWRLVDGKVVVDLTAAQEIATNNLNAWAKQEYLDRAVDDAIGVQSAARLAATEDFATVLQRGRDAIAAATSVAQLTPIVVETEAEAKDAPLEVTK